MVWSAQLEFLVQSWGVQVCAHALRLLCQVALRGGGIGWCRGATDRCRGLLQSTCAVPCETAARVPPHTCVLDWGQKKHITICKTGVRFFGVSSLFRLEPIWFLGALSFLF